MRIITTTLLEGHHQQPCEEARPGGFGLVAQCGGCVNAGNLARPGSKPIWILNQHLSRSSCAELIIKELKDLAVVNDRSCARSRREGGARRKIV